MPVTFTITGADYAPEDLHDQTPLRARLIRQIPGTDRPDYWLAELDRPVTWRRDRVPGSGVRARIAYVTDQTVLEDDALDSGKCRYVAIGNADTIDA